MIGASLVFGINYSSMKLVLIFFPPFVAALLRFGIAGIVIFFLLRRVEGSIRISRQTLQRLLVSGVVGYGIQQVLFLYGFKFVDASLGALLSAFTNALMTVIASIVAHERLTKWMLGGVLIACLGMGCVVLGKGALLGFTAATWIGCALVIGSSIIGGFTPIINKQPLAQHSPLRVTAWSILIGSLFFLPLGSFDANEVAWMQLPWTVMAALLFTALCVTVLAYTLWNYGVASIGVVRMTIYGYLPPVIGVLMATVLLHEYLTPVQWLGTAVTMGGVAVSQVGKIAVQ